MEGVWLIGTVGGAVMVGSMMMINSIELMHMMWHWLSIVTVSHFEWTIMYRSNITTDNTLVQLY